MALMDWQDSDATHLSPLDFHSRLRELALEVAALQFDSKEACNSLKVIGFIEQATRKEIYRVAALSRVDG